MSDISILSTPRGPTGAMSFTVETSERLCASAAAAAAAVEQQHEVLQACVTWPVNWLAKYLKAIRHLSDWHVQMSFVSWVFSSKPLFMFFSHALSPPQHQVNIIRYCEIMTRWPRIWTLNSDILDYMLVECYQLLTVYNRSKNLNKVSEKI